MQGSYIGEYRRTSILCEAGERIWDFAMIKPRTHQEVIDFIGSEFSAMIIVNEDTGEALLTADVTYVLTAHDLLSAFERAEDALDVGLYTPCESCIDSWIDDS